MVSKNIQRRKNNTYEKYILIILTLFYILGVASGCYFVLSNNENKIFVEYISTAETYKVFLYFIFAFLLKYSGIFNVAIYLLPFFAGIENSVHYCNIITNKSKIDFAVVVDVLKDTSVVMLLILYCIIIILQIINKRFKFKKDIRYFSVYTGAVSVILALEFVLKNIIF